jgi:hypothetical protein
LVSWATSTSQGKFLMAFTDISQREALGASKYFSTILIPRAVRYLTSRGVSAQVIHLIIVRN